MGEMDKKVWDRVIPSMSSEHSKVFCDLVDENLLQFFITDKTQLAGWAIKENL
jgi:hypothetical protein